MTECVAHEEAALASHPLRQAGEYIITSGAFKGQRGFFTRDESGAVVGVDLAGRLFNRVPTSSE